MSFQAVSDRDDPSKNRCLDILADVESLNNKIVRLEQILLKDRANFEHLKQHIRISRAMLASFHQADKARHIVILIIHPLDDATVPRTLTHARSTGFVVVVILIDSTNTPQTELKILLDGQAHVQVSYGTLYRY
ncbi:hypothetical protein EUX98_g1092 [Antrodiella citrinella]|uniref:Uncharacterized protein n=1 Tax=Antrodiella citrinella TaxID=2447956 RepID=A0A4S4N3Y7_9APHY|nr:hypothetical protein EUX98_g1092 [Antrodiella citrinella]